MHRHFIALTLAVAVTAGAFGQTSQKLTAGKANEYGLIYSLPLTAIDIYLEAELSEQTPGEYSNYARRHLGITNAIAEPSRKATLLSLSLIHI